MSPNKKDGSVGYYESTVVRITFWVTLVLASLLPVVGVWGIAEQPMGEMLCTQMRSVAVCNLLASVCLGFFAQPSRAAVFLFAAL